MPLLNASDPILVKDGSTEVARIDRGGIHAAAKFMRRQITVPSQIATAGNETYTAAQIVAGLIDRDPAGAGRSDTLPTAAALVAAMPGVRVGDVLVCRISNQADAAEAITLVTNTGLTLHKSAGVGTIGQNVAKEVLFIFTNVTGGAEAVTVIA